MSKASKHKEGAAKRPTPADDAPVRPDTMSRGRRLVLMGIAIFCLLIFSVTGPMAETLGRWFFSGGVRAYATMKLPDGDSAEISVEDYRTALAIQQFKTRLLRGGDDSSEERILYWAAMDKLADAYEMAISTQELRETVLAFTGGDARSYQNLYRGVGYSRPSDFEAMLARLMRLQKMEQMLASASVVTEDAVVREWQELYREIRFSWGTWSASEFAEAAAGLEPTEEQLQEYFDDKLTPLQRLDLEREETAKFTLLVVDAEAAMSDGVRALIGSDFDPSAAALQEFYNSRSLSLYRRQDPQEGESAVLSMEEIGDRLLRDFRTHTALKQAYLSLVGGADAAAFAQQHGLRLHVQAEPVTLSEIEKLEDYGAFQLRMAYSGTPGTWLENPVMLPQPKSLGYLIRPDEVTQRAMPTFAEVREQVAGFWREGEQQRLAREAATEFVGVLPKQADWVDGDPTVIGEEEFSQALAAERRPQNQIDWIARTPRLTTDPPETFSSDVTRRVRSLLSGRLGDLVDGQVVGPEDFGELGVVVIHLAGRRDADPSRIWPSEVARARALAQQKAAQAFVADQLSFEGFAKAWELTKLIDAESAE